jgi:hypothetical protein
MDVLVRLSQVERCCLVSIAAGSHGLTVAPRRQHAGPESLRVRYSRPASDHYYTQTRCVSSHKLAITTPIDREKDNFARIWECGLFLATGNRQSQPSRCKLSLILSSW